MVIKHLKSKYEKTGQARVELSTQKIPYKYSNENKNGSFFKFMNVAIVSYLVFVFSYVYFHY